MAVFPVQPQCLSVFLSVSVRVYEILAGKTKIIFAVCDIRKSKVKKQSVEMRHLGELFTLQNSFMLLLA